MKRLIVSVVGMSLTLGSVSVLAATSLNSEQDKISYSMGYMTGKAMRSHSVSVNPEAFAAGLTDGSTQAKPQLSEADMQKSLNDFQNQQIAAMKAKLAKEGAENKTKGEAFLADNKSKAGVVTTADGLQYKVIEAGTGNSPTLEDTVTVNYEGRLIDGKVFDSSYKQGKPVTFPVNQVIKGWQEALTLMKPGATWEIYIPASLGYSDQGVPGAIGPNETLIFKVNLISVTPKQQQASGQAKSQQ